MVHHLSGQEARVAGLGDTHALQHLLDDNLNMTVINIDTLDTVNLLYFTRDIVLYRFHAQDIQNIMRIQRTFRQAIALSDDIAIMHSNSRSEGNRVGFLVPVV